MYGVQSLGGSWGYVEYFEAISQSFAQVTRSTTPQCLAFYRMKSCDLDLWKLLRSE